MAARAWVGMAAGLVSAWRSGDLNDITQPAMQLSRQKKAVQGFEEEKIDKTSSLQKVHCVK